MSIAGEQKRNPASTISCVSSASSRAFFGEVDPVRRQKMRHGKEES
jgi:hypothetical protein